MPAKQAGQQTSKQAHNKANKQASKQQSKQAGRQAGKQANKQVAKLRQEIEPLVLALLVIDDHRGRATGAARTVGTKVWPLKGDVQHLAESYLNAPPQYVYED